MRMERNAARVAVLTAIAGSLFVGIVEGRTAHIEHQALAAVQRDRERVLSNLREARAKAAKGSDGWNPRQILSEPEFRFVKDDPQFVSIVSSLASRPVQ